MTLTKQIQNLTQTDTVALRKIIPVTELADQERAESIELLKRCRQWVGMSIGEEVEAHIAKYEGKRFDAKEYHYEKQVDSQSI